MQKYSSGEAEEFPGDGACGRDPAIKLYRIHDRYEYLVSPRARLERDKWRGLVFWIGCNGHPPGCALCSGADEAGGGGDHSHLHRPGVRKSSLKPGLPGKKRELAAGPEEI